MMKTVALLGCLLAGAALAQDAPAPFQDAPIASPLQGVAESVAVLIMRSPGEGVPPVPVVTIGWDGSVTIGEGFTADDAAREFWAAVGASIPFKCEVK